MHLMQCVITLWAPTAAIVAEDMLEMVSNAVSPGQNSGSSEREVRSTHLLYYTQYNWLYTTYRAES